MTETAAPASPASRPATPGPSPGPSPGPPPSPPPSPSQGLPGLTLGLLVLAAERTRADSQAGSDGAPEIPEPVALLVGWAGTIEDAAARASYALATAAAPPGRVLLAAGQRALRLPGLRLLRPPAERAAEAAWASLRAAASRGRGTIEDARAAAIVFLRDNVDDALVWAQADVTPRVVDDLVPHLVTDVVPRIVEGILPEVRARVVPLVIADLVNDPRVQDLIVQQSRGVLANAADQLHDRAATADERVEERFRRLFRRHPGPATVSAPVTPSG